MITIYTDGACSGNPGPGGWCAIIENDGVEKETIYGGEKSTTNNRMELTAVTKALELVPIGSEVSVVSDSKYVCDAVNQKWLLKWRANGWRSSTGKPVANQDLWAEFCEALENVASISFTWVRGHSGHPQNEECDRIASAVAQGYATESGETRISDKNADVIYTHTEAAEIVDIFEDLLDKYNITVPSPEDDEKEPDNRARLYGTVYYMLLDEIEGRLIDIIDRRAENAVVVSYVFG